MKFKELAHDYQKVVVNHLIKYPKCGIFVDMGLGKTASCLYAFSFLKQKGKVERMLIIAPKFVALHTWKDEIKKWQEFTNLTINIAVGNENTRLNAFENKSDIVIINRDNVSWMHKNVSMASFQVLCVDELSSFKNPKANRTLSLFKVIYNFKYRWGLTGTPVPKGYLDLFGQMLVIEPKLFGFNFWSYRNKYFYESSKYSWNLKAGKKEEIDTKLKEVCISLTAKDYLTMPPCINNHISVEMDKKTLTTYKKALNEMVYSLGESNLELHKNLTIKLQQLASGFIYDDNKKPITVHNLLISKLEEIYDCTEGNILLFYNFQAERDLILKTFKAKELKKDKDFIDWNNGKIKMAISHPQSLGYGMNLQAGGNNIIWYGYNWDSSSVMQANARLYRQGQKNGVVINYLYVKQTIHEHMNRLINKKLSMHDIMMESVKYLKNNGIIKITHKV